MALFGPFLLIHESLFPDACILVSFPSGLTLSLLFKYLQVKKMNIEPARPFCFLMKGDNTTYEVDLGKKRKERKKEIKPEPDQV